MLLLHYLLGWDVPGEAAVGSIFEPNFERESAGEILPLSLSKGQQVRVEGSHTQRPLPAFICALVLRAQLLQLGVLAVGDQLPQTKKTVTVRTVPIKSYRL